MALHEELWRHNSDLAQACLEHPFVRALGDGSLDRAAFKRYVAQDAFFLRSFLKAYAMAAARTDTTLHVNRLIDLMRAAVDELNLHSRYARELDIEIDQVRPYTATRDYTEFLNRVAWHEPVGVIYAALTPCMRLYAFLGSELAVGRAATNPYHAWIETYASEAFGGMAATLEMLLDDTASDEPRIRDAYRFALQCELNFFSAPLDAGGA